MIKKDYRVLANALKKSVPTEAEQEQGTALSGWIKTVVAVAGAIRKEDSDLDYHKFLKDCGL